MKKYILNDKLKKKWKINVWKNNFKNQDWIKYAICFFYKHFLIESYCCWICLFKEKNTFAHVNLFHLKCFQPTHTNKPYEYKNNG